MLHNNTSGMLLSRPCPFLLGNDRSWRWECGTKKKPLRKVPWRTCKLWYRTRLEDRDFVLCKLHEKGIVGSDNISSRLHKRVRFSKTHTLTLHEISKTKRHGSRDTSSTVNHDTSSFTYRTSYEFIASSEVSFQICGLIIVHVHVNVLESIRRRIRNISRCVHNMSNP